jgi:dihydropteroate synthase
VAYAVVPGLPAPGRTVVIGVVNVTPDSFSDGGLYIDHDAAVQHGLDLIGDGADIVDVGGESTRPGAERVPADVELGRVVPVVRDLVAAGTVVSVDTTRAEVAEAALDVGAVLVNDVSGGRADPAMVKTVAAAGAPYVVMHSRGPSVDMVARASYDDVVIEVRDELVAQVDAAVDAGVARERIIIDPGIGFAKSAAHNWSLLAHVDVLADLGQPLLVGVSRKSFLGALLADALGTPRPVDDRDDATTALTAVLAALGVWGVRVHDVRGSADAVRVFAELKAARETPK